MSVVGRAYVTVRAVTRQVEGDIKRGVEGALDRIDTKISEQTGEKLGQGVGEGVKKSKVDESIDEAVKKYDADRGGRDVGNVLGESIGDALLEQGPIERAFRRAAALLERDAESEGDSIGVKLGGGIGKGLFKVASSPMTWLGALALPAISDALTAVGAAAGSATALVSTLGPAAAAAGAVGASGMGALLTTIGAVTLAFKVQSNALDEFKATLRPVRDEWLGIGEDVQEVLLPALSSAAASITENLGPTLRDGLVETGDAVGDIAGRFEKLAENEMFQRRLGVTMEANAEAMRDFGAAGALGLGAMASITAAAAPLTTRFSQATRELALHVTQQLAAAESSGRLGAWFENASRITEQWGRIIGDVASALFNTFSIGVDEGEGLLSMLEGLTSRWEAWTESVGGQNAIRDWFEDSRPVIEAFGNVVEGLVEGLDEWAGTNEQAADTLNAIADILPDVGSVLGGLTSVARNLIEAVAPAVGEIVDLVPAVEDLGDQLADNLGPALESVVPPLVDLASAALDIVGNFTPVLPVLGTLAGTTAEVLTPALEGVAAILDALPDSVVGVVGAVVALRIAMRQLSNSARFGGMATSARESFTGIRDQMRQTQGAAGKFRAGLRGVTGALGGPWGLAFTGATLVLGHFMQKSAESEARVDALTQTFDEQTGAITENTRTMVANNLEKSGALEAARTLGISLEDVTDAAMGEADAIERVRNQIMEQSTSMTGAFAANDEWSTKIKDLIGVLGDEEVAVNVLRNGLKAAGGEFDAASASSRRLREATGQASSAIAKGLAPTVERTAKVEAQLARGAQSVERGLKGQEGAQKDLTAATLAYHDATLKLKQGQIGLEQSIDDASAEMEKGKKTLDINTQAGRDNYSALLDIAAAAGSVEGSAEKQTRALERGRRKIIEYANQIFKDKDKAKAFADELISVTEAADDIPGQIDTKVNARTEDARRALEAIHRQLGRIDGDVATIEVQANIRDNTKGFFAGTGYKPPGAASGGWILGPGTSTSDSIRYGSHMVSNREFVVNAEDAARNARLLEAINSGKDVSTVGSRGQLSIVVNNPIPERASTSTNKALRQAAYEAGWTL